MSFKPHNSCPYKKHVYPELWHLSYRCPLKSLLSGVGSADLLHSFSLCLNLWNTPVCVHTLPVGCTSTQRRETAAVIGVLNDCLLIFLPLLVSLAAPHVWTVNVTFICLPGPGSPADSLYWRFQRGLSCQPCVSGSLRYKFPRAAAGLISDKMGFWIRSGDRHGKLIFRCLWHHEMLLQIYDCLGMFASLWRNWRRREGM